MWIIKTRSLGPDPLFDLARGTGAGLPSLVRSWLVLAGALGRPVPGSGVAVGPEGRNMINSHALKRQVKQPYFQLSYVYLFLSISVRERMLFSG